MPITYEIDRDSGILIEKWSGEIMPLETTQHWHALTEDPNFQRVSFALSDLREANLAFRGPELWRAVDDHYREILETMTVKVALVVTNDQQELVARQWATIVPKTIRAKVLCDYDKALEWLKSAD
jgi:hypothetical protein